MSLMMMRAALIARNALPPQYQRVEYLESTGDQYIRTGYIPNDQSGFNITFSKQLTAADQIAFGCRTLSYGRWWMNTSSYINISWNEYRNTSVQTILDKKYNVKCNFMNNRRWYLDDVEFSVGHYIMETPLFEQRHEAYIFAGNNAGDVLPSVYKIFSLIISEGERVVRKYIPCRRKSDNKPGMWDTVSKTFFINQGTGADFTLGPDVL